MIVLDEVYISEDLLDNFFVCDLEKCQGACCVEGDLGAPLEDDELPILESVLEEVKPFLMPEGLKAIEEQGAYVLDTDREYSTPTIGNKECAYAYYDGKGILKCGIEAAYRAGKIDFHKPMSCHLYPIRITKLEVAEALNYNRWQICDPACELGASLSVPIYQFLKEPLVRRYGEDWYRALEEIIADRDEESN